MNQEKHELKISIQDLIQNIKQRVDSICEELQKNQIETANERVIFLIEDISALIDGISHISESYPSISIEELQEKLTLLIKEMQKKDYAMFRDLLKYELKPVIEDWGLQIADA